MLDEQCKLLKKSMNAKMKLAKYSCCAYRFANASMGNQVWKIIEQVGFKSGKTSDMSNVNVDQINAKVVSRCRLAISPH